MKVIQARTTLKEGRPARLQLCRAYLLIFYSMICDSHPLKTFFDTKYFQNKTMIYQKFIDFGNHGGVWM
jgi:hypothetical protein